MRDDAGRITHLIYSASDASERKAGEEALQRSEQRFRRVVESAPEGLARVDKGGHMVLVNAGLERILGYRRDELQGRHIEMLMPTSRRVPHGGRSANCMVRPEARDMADRKELHAVRKDGSEFPVEIGLNPTHTESGPLVLATIQDVTTRRADRRLIEQAPEARTVRLHEVHHRVRNNRQEISSLLNLQTRAAAPKSS